MAPWSLVLLVAVLGAHPRTNAVVITMSAFADSCAYMGAVAASWSSVSFCA